MSERKKWFDAVLITSPIGWNLYICIFGKEFNIGTEYLNCKRKEDE